MVLLVDGVLNGICHGGHLVGVNSLLTLISLILKLINKFIHIMKKQLGEAKAKNAIKNQMPMNIFKNIFSKKIPKKQCKVVMLGLDGAGKTTILYSLKLGDVINTIPTIGFNVEELNFKTVKFMVWDVGGQ